MALATFVIGILPTYQAIGVWASLGLILCRLIQGLSFGAEMPSAITFITENSTAKNKFLNNSLLCSSATLGAILANVVMQSLADKVSELWRIPFLLGGSLAIFAFILRKMSFNDNNFNINKTSLLTPLKLIVQQHKLNFILAIIFFLFSAVLVIAYMYYAAYFSTYFNYTAQNVYQFSTIGLLVCAISLPVFAKLFVNKNPYTVAAIIALTFALYQVVVINLQILNTNNTIFLGVYLIVHQIFIAAFNSVAYTALAELFPANIRATTVALVYNLSFMLASFLPALTASLVERTNHNILLWILIIASIAACCAAMWQRTLLSFRLQ
jgi:MFS family permease